MLKKRELGHNDVGYYLRRCLATDLVATQQLPRGTFRYPRDGKKHQGHKAVEMEWHFP